MILENFRCRVKQFCSIEASEAFAPLASRKRYHVLEIRGVHFTELDDVEFPEKRFGADPKLSLKISRIQRMQTL